MNDRFRFKVWDSEANQFFEEHTTKALQLHLRPDGCLGFFSGKTGIEGLVICMCTGLKDKNGKLIYEGDILKYLIDGEPWQNVVERHESTGGWIPFAEASGNVYSNEYEVIGNQYESPELLSLPKEDEQGNTMVPAGWTVEPGDTIYASGIDPNEEFTLGENFPLKQKKP